MNVDNECEHNDINWDSEPDWGGTHGISMYWFGECEDCGVQMMERFTSHGAEVAD